MQQLSQGFIQGFSEKGEGVGGGMYVDAYNRHTHASDHSLGFCRDFHEILYIFKDKKRQIEM